MASVARNTMEKDTSKPISAHSTFMNGYPLAGTYRFGQIQPHFVQEVVPDDDIELSTSYKLDTYTLGQPMMQDMFITHGYYFVPMPALLPRNYEKFITNPVIGDDIDFEQVGLSWDFNNLKTVFLSITDYLSFLIDEGVSSSNYGEFISWVIRWVMAFDMIYGLGGLPASLGYKFITKDHQIAFEKLLVDIQDIIFNGSEIIVETSSQTNPRFDNLHNLLEFLRDDYDFSLFSTESDDEAISSYVPDLFNLILSFAYNDIGSFPLPSPGRVNVGRILSYQIVCNHFFSNDKIDYIYSAELYRQNVLSILNLGSFAQINGKYPSFVYNGEDYLYDVFSAYNFNFLEFADDEPAYIISDLQYLRLIFGFNNSLRHVDYFTGSRSHPLAVGDVGVRVNDGFVDVVENIQTTWFAKFLNQVNRTGRRLSNYIKGLFPSAAISQDWHEPLWLGDTTDKVGSSENQNTAEGQFRKNAISSNLQSNANKYGFRYHNTQYYGWIIGVCYFDLERFYSEVTERPIFHVDRFDMFNPFMQFNGDQEVYSKELNVSGYRAEDTFGYQSRYLEYKERVPQCFGGFEVDPILSKSIFIADSEKKDVSGYMPTHISPSYIRSHPLEFDKFYTSLTGLSLANYYHFQIIHWNRVKSVRPMVFNPQLG